MTTIYRGIKRGKQYLMRLKMVKLNRGMSWSTRHVLQVVVKVQGHDLKVIIVLVEIHEFHEIFAFIRKLKIQKIQLATCHLTCTNKVQVL